jgi:hypothetical protein
MTESGFEGFRQLVFSDDALQKELGILTDRKDFVSRLVDLGAARGHRFASTDVEEALRTSRGEQPHHATSVNAQSYHDWVPIRFYWENDAAFVEWCFLGDDRFTDPFFQDTIRRRMSLPFNRLFPRHAPVALLRDVFENAAVVPPTGFIFHMSRCGSTLVAQMLASLSKNIVISEAPPVDSVIRARATDNDRQQWLKWMIGVLGRKRNASELNYFVKFDSWNILDFDLIRAAFPAVPSIFLYRNPVEVIVSHMRQRGLQMVPGGTLDSLLPEVSVSQSLEMPAEEYCARILGKLCSRALEQAEDRTLLLINYNQLPDAVTKIITRHLGAGFSAEDERRMNEASRYDAKTPQMNFEPDSERKRTDASETARAAAAAWVDPIYEQLETIRSGIV